MARRLPAPERARPVVERQRGWGPLARVVKVAWGLERPPQESFASLCFRILPSRLLWRQWRPALEAGWPERVLTAVARGQGRRPVEALVWEFVERIRPQAEA